MSDFLVTFDRSINHQRLLMLLRQPYGATRREGRSWSQSWGAVAILEDAVARGRNIVDEAGYTGGWVGDAPLADDAVRNLLTCLSKAEKAGDSADEVSRALVQSRGVNQLNGSFASVLAGKSFACVITDLMAGVQVYVARNAQQEVLAFGTHPDLVASVAGLGDAVDPVSVGDFLNTGTPCCPHTMYCGVTELAPGHVVVVGAAAEGVTTFAQHPYWRPPREINGQFSLEETAEEFGRVWREAVARRCQGQSIGVQLSGGLDSRIVIAAIPQTKRCVGLTFCDELNREAKIAGRVAQVYGRQWHILHRDPEYLARTAVDAVRLTGCEGEWHHAHAIGFVKEIAGMGFDEVFTGLFMDNNFKGYYARDLVLVPRGKGLLPPTYRVQKLDYVDRISELGRNRLKPGILEGVVHRRRQFYEHHVARGRQSELEWLDGYPLTQASDNTGWIVERRLFPMRLPVYDRQLVDLAFRVPVLWKAGGRFFVRSALKVLGPGREIPNANDGVLPGSGHGIRLLQRAWRKAQNRGRHLLRTLGVKTVVPHSWHDYQQYWRESAVLKELIREHGQNLRRFEGEVFVGDSQKWLSEEGLYWREAYRLVQLAVWLSLIRTYRI